MNAQAIQERDAMHADIASITDMTDATRVYQTIVGHDEHGCTTVQEVRELLQGYVREYCYSVGVQCPEFAA